MSAGASSHIPASLQFCRDRAETALSYIFSDLIEDAPGAIGAIIQGDDVVGLKSVGLSNLNSAEPFSRRTRTRIASISKPMAAQVVMELARRGLIGIDTRIAEYLPHLPEVQGRTTIRQLLSMKSGLREEHALLYLAAGDGAINDHTLAQRIPILDRQTTANFEPGSRTIYCNTNYTLLQRIAERVSQQTFSALLREIVFDPAGMRTASFGNRFATYEAGIGTAYQKVETGFLPFEYLADSTAAGGIIASLDDLIAWHLWNRTSANGLWDAIAEPQIHSDGSPSNYGLGVEHKTLSGIATCGHAGGLRGWAMDYVRVPSADSALIVLSNRSDMNWYERAREGVITYLDLPPDPAATPRLFRANAPTAEWEETYGNEDQGAAIAFSGAGRELKFESRWMLQRNDGTYCRSLGPEPFVFSVDDASQGSPSAINVREGNVLRTYVKRGTRPSPELDLLQGLYEAEELPGRVAIAKLNGRFTVSCGPDWPLGTLHELRPVTGGLFRGYDIDSGAGVDLFLLWPDLLGDPDLLNVSMTRLIRYPFRKTGGVELALRAMRFRNAETTLKEPRR